MTTSDDPSATTPATTPIYDSQVDATRWSETDTATSAGAGQGGSSQGGGSQGTAGQVKDEAKNVAGTAADAGREVAGVAKEQAKNVAGEAKSQVRDLYHQSQRELRDQAAQQQERVADGLRSVSDELHQMAAASDSNGVASDLVRQAADRTHSVAEWLGARDPGSLLNEVKSYARRNPGTFIAVAAVAGALVGRLGRSLAANASDDADSSGTTGTAGSHDAPPTTPPATYTAPPTGFDETGTVGGVGDVGFGAPGAAGPGAADTGIYTEPGGFTGTGGLDDTGLDGGRR
ncbi:hypothetical protein P5G50_05925 [Leifsonia sp. F6_8S_P_1B]|uniref:Uncharacterized protein n=1 Tax=Leifsonia williamsii TaxID=3035919 RepID=A0ABT8K947_9MICO|nr:hypothetical protein [Leifsonia williamsii]MDN4613988.1 hypothetical protein [Leifsonia williamsii]